MDNQSLPLVSPRESSSTQMPVTPLPQSPPPSGSSWIKWIVLSTLFIALTVVGGLYVLNTKQEKQTAAIQPTQPPSPTPTSNLSTEATESATANWKTYTNNEYGYIIDYPVNWMIDVWPIDAEFMPKDEHIVNFGKYKLPLSSSEKDYKKLGYMIEITVNKGKTLRDEIQKEDSNNKGKQGYKKEKTTFNGLPAYKTYNTGFDHPRDNLLFENDGKVYRISIHYLVPDEFDESDKIYNQILSTFKFTDQTEGVACAQDVNQCPDGSYVGREPPSCNFAACPK